ncbi:MAG: OmpH family outer membrane protein [Lentisphaeraceae bacterium]|nr:OmpH family outer membrane protein [Lentisphaeraceae bacterium]
MKNLFFLITFGLCSMLSAQKIATIDMDRTFLDYYKTIGAEKKLKKQVRIMEDRAAEMERRHKTIVAEYQKLLNESSSVLLSEEARAQKKEEAENKAGEIKTIERTMRSFNKDARGMLAKQHNDSRQDILEEIKKVIEMIAKNKTVDLVLDTSGKTSNLISGVVYNKGNNDITEEVLSILNKGHEKEVEEYKKEKSSKKTEEKK